MQEQSPVDETGVVDIETTGESRSTEQARAYVSQGRECERANETAWARRFIYRVTSDGCQE
jgi:hypothetical protein